MAIELITKDDFTRFKQELFSELKTFLTPTTVPIKRWLKTHEVLRLLKISSGTLQTLRINGTIKAKKVGGTLYYDYIEIEKMLSK